MNEVVKDIYSWDIIELNFLLYVVVERMRMLKEKWENKNGELFWKKRIKINIEI